MVKAKEVYDKVNKAYQVFDRMKNLGSDVVEKFATILKNDFGGILKNIKWKNNTWGAVMSDVNPQAFWTKIQQYFPGSPLSRNPNNPLELSYDYQGLNIRFYPDANTTTSAGVPCYTLAMKKGSYEFKVGFCE